MAASIKSRLGVEPEVTKGSFGEFSVWVEGVVVAKKNWLGILPSDESVLRAVESRMGPVSVR